MVFVLFLYFPLCIAVAILASRYNRSGIGWFFFSLFLSPVLGFAFVLACGPKAPPPVDNRPIIRKPPEDLTAARAGTFAVLGTVGGVVMALVVYSSQDERGATKTTEAATTKAADVSATKVMDWRKSDDTRADQIIAQAKAAAKVNTGKVYSCAGPASSQTCAWVDVRDCDPAIRYEKGRKRICAGKACGWTGRADTCDPRRALPSPIGKVAVCDDKQFTRNCRYVDAKLWR